MHLSDKGVSHPRKNPAEKERKSHGPNSSRAKGEKASSERHKKAEGDFLLVAMGVREAPPASVQQKQKKDDDEEKAKKANFVLRKEVQHDGMTVVIHTSVNSKVTIPVPSNGFVCSISEFILMMDEMITNQGTKGWKAFIAVLVKQHMLKISYIPLKQLYDDYLKSGRKKERLPHKDLYVVPRGMPRIVPSRALLDQLGW